MGQWLNIKDGYEPLEGMALPPFVNLIFICTGGNCDGNQ